MNIHLVYPHGSKISCPDAIGRNVGKRLAKQYNIIYHDWDVPEIIKLGNNDVLLGHPHPSPFTCFRMNMKQKGWRRIIAMSPYNHGDNMQVAFFDSIISHCDLYLAITGNYWFYSNKNSLYSHWSPKMVLLDLAIDRKDFPIIKTHFNKPGKRQFVYIGHSGWTKNTDYLSIIAKRMPDNNFYWIGRGKKNIERLISLGFQDFSTDQGKKMVAEHDFMITVSKADSNPTTILESMAWGLIPVCTPQSGYINYPGIVNIPLNDVTGAVEILQQLQYISEEQLKEIQFLNWKALDEHFNWDRFTNLVIDAIESNNSPKIDKVTLKRYVKIRWLSLISPYFYLRPHNIMIFLLKAIIRKIKGDKVGI